MNRTGNVGVRAERTRAAILEAAETLFAKQGFAATRLEDVANAVGIKRASIVYYFSAKRELYQAVLDAAFAELLRVHAVAGRGPGTLEERLEEMVNAWIDFAFGRPTFIHLLVREISDGSPAMQEQIRNAIAPIFAEVTTIASEGIRAGTFREVDPVDTFTILGGASIFYILATPMLEPGWEPKGAGLARVEQHRKEVLRVMRTLFGIRGPRLVRTGRKHGDG